VICLLVFEKKVEVVEVGIAAIEEIRAIAVWL
jgi:hypothetical protein